MKQQKRFLSLLLSLLMVCGLFCGCSAAEVADAVDMAMDVAEILEDIQNAAPDETPPPVPGDTQTPLPDKDGSYDSAEDVALYIHSYGCLPPNYVTKSEARAAGWEGGSVEDYLPGKCIGGDRFGNREGLLPKAEGRSWTECDIDTLGQNSRGAKRILFSNDGLIYYTDDHYESFTLLYGEP